MIAPERCPKCTMRLFSFDRGVCPKCDEEEEKEISAEIDADRGPEFLEGRRPNRSKTRQPPLILDEDMSLETMLRRHVTAVYNRFKGKSGAITQAARALGCTTKTLYNYIDRYGLGKMDQ